jgi:hypothetical protein
MMGFVVDDEDVLLVAEVAADTANHLIGGLGKGIRVAAGEDRLGELRRLNLLAQAECVEVRDQNLGLAEPFEEMAGQDIPLAVVVVRVVRQKHAQPVADRDAGSDDEEGVGELGVLGVGELVERLPRDEHGHHDGLSGAGGHLERDAGQTGVGAFVGFSNLVLDPGVAAFAGSLGKVNRGFEGLKLAEEELAFALGVGPVFEQVAGRGSNGDVSPLSPSGHALADSVDHLVLFDTVPRPFGVELKLLCRSSSVERSARNRS